MTEEVHIGQYPDSGTRERVTGVCSAKHHNGSNCAKAHTGGTHSLGPEWGKASKYTDKRETKGK